MSIRCRYCRHRVEGPADAAGSRCPECFEPLFERTRVPKLVFNDLAQDESACALHPHNLAVSTCERCGNYMCPVCRTRWQDRVTCPACVERALESRPTAPEAARQHFRQAILALVFGLASWAVLLAAFGLLLLFMESSDNSAAAGLVILGGLVIMLSPFLSAVGIGQGAAAIRARGDHMILATCGLLLSALQGGVLLGLFLLSVLNS